MFGFFSKKTDYTPILLEMEQTQERWLTFLDKLEERAALLCTDALPALKDLFEQDDDPYKRAHGHMLMGLIGQLSQMRTKANTVHEEKILSFMYTAKHSLPDLISKEGGRYHDLLHTFRMTCSERHRVFEEQINAHITTLQATGERHDLEARYQEELVAFEHIKDKFRCQQCGGHITIPQLFFIATYISCPYCHTQNTFFPSTGAQMVLNNARSLAEQRTAHLLAAYETGHPKDKTLYRNYLRAMFDEWNKIVPDMKDENEKFYQRLLEDSHTNHHY